MKRLGAFIVILVSFTGLVSNAYAQSRNEIGLLLGSRVGGDPGTTPKLEIGKSLAFQATYARWLVESEAVALALEVPFVALPSQDVTSAAQTAPRNFASIFITPGIRMKLAPNAPISPWASVGGGYARFAESTTLVTGSLNPFVTGTNKGALQFGGGVDVKSPVNLLLPLSLRGEVRDFYSGQPRFNTVSTNSGQHNVLVSGGVVLRF